MYWEEDLERLAAHKAALQRSIARNRAQFAIAAGQVSRPVVLLDRAVAIWRRLPGLVKAGAVPLGLFATRTAFRRRGTLRSLVRWVPLAITVARGLNSRVGRGRWARRP